jgi:hypothetical protein
MADTRGQWFHIRANCPLHGTGDWLDQMIERGRA